MRPSKKNVSFRLPGKREIVEFGYSTFYDTIFCNSLPATEQNHPLCWKFLLLDEISREIAKVTHREKMESESLSFLKWKEYHCEELGAAKRICFIPIL
ncbi:hypothetical protein CEXT_3481 [Caerostris extrusa]|uniref:Uncharacterized protein n=1 Tax=Caerostris extrusa TaxID=172846 RepID=A0AAV4QBS4_CAEEX|nr:hypothetical protein CEXT_3481 [Caerostris extrusa]